jgi:hypothetical protein
VTFDEMEAALRARLEALAAGGSRRADPRPAAARPRPGGPDRHLLGRPETRTFGELLIDLEEDKAYKAVVWGSLREIERK